jgi:hypothetical protein
MALRRARDLEVRNKSHGRPTFAIDTVARALASPMSRRRAIGVISGTLLAGSGLRPRSARAAGLTCPPSSDPTATLRCQSTVGDAALCAPADWHCCSNPVCAGACKPWEKCSNGGSPQSGCDDTPALCTDPRVADGTSPKFCSVRLSSQAGICHDDRTLTYGWCCGKGTKCGSAFGQCECSGTSCGNDCCGQKEYCESGFISESVCLKLCPDGSRPCNGVCCTGLEQCTFTGCSCKAGYVSCGSGRCCLPKDDPGDPHPGWNPLRSMFNMMGESSSAHGGHSADSLLAGLAQTGGAGVEGALTALAAVTGQNAAALLAIRGGTREANFKRRVTVFRAKPPTISAGAGLDVQSAAALTKLLAAEARANALIAAMATALWRSRAAHSKHDRLAARRQLRASAMFAGQAASALRRLPALRAAAARTLTAQGVVEVFASDAEVAAFIAGVRSHGIPSSLRLPLGRLGVTGAGLAHLRAGVLGQTVTSASGPVLIAPLRNPARATELRQLATELSRYSTRARRHPIAR